MSVKTAGVGQFQIPTAPAALTAVAQSGSANTLGSAVSFGNAPSAMYITGVHVGAATTQTPTYVQIQILVAASIVGSVIVSYGVSSAAANSVVTGFRPIFPPIPVANGAAITVKSASSVASAVNWGVSLECIAQSNVVDDGITVGTVNLVNTVTTVTNQLTAAAIATGVWQDAVAGDFTVASSIGKALYIANVAPGGAGGHFISGSNAGTTTLGALTVTGLTTHTGNFLLSDGLTISAPSTTDRAGITITGNGAGAGIIATGGATGDGVKALSGAAGHGFVATGAGASKHGILATGGTTTAHGIAAVGGSSSGDAINATATANGIGINAAGSGVTKPGILGTGGATSSAGISGAGGGTGAGILATGGTSGHGISALGGSGSGTGINAAAVGAGSGFSGVAVGNFHGITLAGSGTGHGMLLTGGGTGHGLSAVGGATSGDGISAVATTSGSGLTVTGVGATKFGIIATGGGTGSGIRAVGGATGNGISAIGGATSGNGISASATVGHGLVVSGNGADKHGMVATGGNGGTSDGIKAVAGTGGVPIRGDLTGNITGNLSGSVGSLTTNNDKTGYALSATGSAALTEDYAADGAAPTLNQALYAIMQFQQEKSISGTTMTINKLDGSTPAMTFTLDSATAPTSITRAT